VFTPFIFLKLFLCKCVFRVDASYTKISYKKCRLFTYDIFFRFPLYGPGWPSTMLGSPAGPGGPPQRGLWPLAPAPAPSATSFSTDGELTLLIINSNNCYKSFPLTTCHFNRNLFSSIVNDLVYCLILILK